MRKEIVKKEQNLDIVDRFMKNIEFFLAKYTKSIDLANMEEISRRFSVLSRPFVTNCLDKMNTMLQNLKVSVSSAELVAKTGRVMEILAIVIPEIGTSKCVVVRARIAELIAQTTEAIIRERLIFIKSIYRKRNDQDGVIGSERESINVRKSRVIVGELSNIIGESSYDEFVGELVSSSNRRPTGYYNESHVSDHIFDPSFMHQFIVVCVFFRFQYNLNEEIRRELKRFFDVISKADFDFSDKLKTRDFVHLYEFQKYFLHKSIRRLTELVKVKQHHYFMQKRNIDVWKKLGKFD